MTLQEAKDLLLKVQNKESVTEDESSKISEAMKIVMAASFKLGVSNG